MVFKKLGIGIVSTISKGNFNKVVRARAPLRLGLAGGGTDVSPYADLYGGYVLNATIDRYAYAVISVSDKSHIKFSATDHSVEKILDPKSEIVLNGKLNLHKAVYNHFIKTYNNGINIPLELSTFCDAPPGSGLGSSSTLVVAMISAFCEFFGLSFDDYSLAALAYKIERIDCGLGGGRQDQYSATFGGFNFMEFSKDSHVLVNPLRVSDWIVCELEASLILFYTGVSRDSEKIIEDQSCNVAAGLVPTIDAMHGIKNEALVMKEALLRGDFDLIVDSMLNGWKCKKQSANSVSNSLVDEIYNCAISAGALAGKVSGAGGGGFMMFFANPNKRLQVISELNKFNGIVSNCHFTNYGAQSWTLK